MTGNLVKFGTMILRPTALYILSVVVVSSPFFCTGCLKKLCFLSVAAVEEL